MSKLFNRTSGILMHISSLPSNYGIGTFGQSAYEFVDFLKKSKVKIWQILPLNLTSFGDSPYQTPASYSFNYYFIDLDILINKGLLKKEEVENIKFYEDEGRVDYGLLYANRIKVLELAFSRFNKTKKFKEFLKNNKKLTDVAFFLTLKRINGFKAWKDFDKKYVNYSEKLENEVKKQFKNIYEFYCWTQFEALNQRTKLKKYANKNGILLMGDIPFYVGYDSLECYKYSKYFNLDKDKNPIDVAGCPPDFFSKSGQLWGNPIYNWKRLKKENYSWIIEKIKYNLEIYDLVRLDHFRGYSGYYSIPSKDKTAEFGTWKKGPGIDLFNNLRNEAIIAEDLGSLDDDFIQMFNSLPYPGMKIIPEGLMHNNFDDDWRIHNVSSRYFLYTSTHDSPLVAENLELNEEQRNVFFKSLSEECSALNVPFISALDAKHLVDTIVELNFSSNSLCSMVTMQDLLYLGKDGRMNLPSSISNSNWSWRIKKDEFLIKKEDISRSLKRLNIKYNRV